MLGRRIGEGVNMFVKLVDVSTSKFNGTVEVQLLHSWWSLQGVKAGVFEVSFWIFWSGELERA
jgi:hypothetical protein